MKATLEENFSIPENISQKYAEWAYNRYSEGNGETEYECIELAAKEYEKVAFPQLVKLGRNVVPGGFPFFNGGGSGFHRGEGSEFAFQGFKTNDRPDLQNPHGIINIPLGKMKLIIQPQKIGRASCRERV